MTKEDLKKWACGVNNPTESWEFMQSVRLAVLRLLAQEEARGDVVKVSAAEQCDLECHCGYPHTGTAE